MNTNTMDHYYYPSMEKCILEDDVKNFSKHIGYVYTRNFFKSLMCNCIRHGSIKIIEYMIFSNEMSMQTDTLNTYFIISCKEKQFEIAKFLLKICPHIDINAHKYKAFLYTCCSGNLNEIKWFYYDLNHSQIDLRMKNERPFIISCQLGNFEMAKWLLKKQPKIKIHIQHEMPMYQACKFNNFIFAQWLYSLDSSKFVWKHKCHRIFIICCQKNYCELASWIATLNDLYVLQIKNKKIIKYLPNKKTIRGKEIQRDNLK